MYLEKLIPSLTLDLQLFAEGGEGGTSGEGATGGIEADAELQMGVESPNPEDNDADIDAEFEESIKGKYKDAFNKRTKSIVKERVKNLKGEIDALTNKANAHAPILEELAFRYGVDIEDANGLLSAIKADTTSEEQKAFEEGKTLEERLRERTEEKEKAKRDR